MSALSDLLTQANTEGLSVDRVLTLMHERGHKIGRDTVWKYMYGGHAKPKTQYLRAFADVFPSVRLRQLEQAAEVPPELGEWTPPAEANALDQRERDALEVLIKSMARGKVGGTVTRFPGRETHQGHPDELAEASMEPRRPGEVQLPPPGVSEEPDT